MSGQGHMMSLSHPFLALAFLACGLLAALVCDGLIEPHAGRHRAALGWQVAALVYWATLWLAVLELMFSW